MIAYNHLASLAKFLVQVVYLVKPGFIEFNKMVAAQNPETRERLKEENMGDKSKERYMAEKQGDRNVRFANYLSLAGLFVALTVTGIYAFLNSPILDYNTITEKIDNAEFGFLKKISRMGYSHLS